MVLIYNRYMEKITRETIDQIKQYDDIVSIINHYVPLKRRGRNYIGLCPFHSERTPSFTVSPEKKIFHCFGCHESGDLIAFVSKIDNLTFSESIEQIANLAGIEVQTESFSKYDSQQDVDRKRVLESLSFLNETFHGALLKNSAMLDYFDSRGVSKASVDEFNLGYAPSNVNLQLLLEKQGVSSKQMKHTGVFYETDQGNLMSRFNDRVMFPIQDFQGRTVGFGGRTLRNDKKVAKYINSEESYIFNKRKILYGLSKAKKAIKKEGHAILVEGYLDVILAHQYGFENVVASMGTALTMEQVLLLKRLTDTVYLALDSDEAGKQATERSFDVLQQYEMKTKIIPINQKDPADVLLANGADAFRQFIDRAQPMIEFIFNRLVEKVNPSNINDVSLVVNSLADHLKKEKDLVVRNHYIKIFSQKLGVDTDIFFAKIKNKYFNISKRLDLKTSKSKVRKAEEFIIYVLVSQQDLRQLISSQINEKDFTTPELRELFISASDSELNANDLVMSMQNAQQKSLLSKIVVEAEQTQSEQIEQEVLDCINTVKESQASVRINRIKEKLKELEKSGSENEVTSLLMELQRLKKGAMNDHDV